jgi:hypothetical protein
LPLHTEPAELGGTIRSAGGAAIAGATKEIRTITSSAMRECATRVS